VMRCYYQTWELNPSQSNAYWRRTERTGDIALIRSIVLSHTISKDITLPASSDSDFIHSPFLLIPRLL